MAKWSGWDWISYGLLGFAALGLAVGTWGKENPEMFSGLPAIFSSPQWAAVPAILFGLATIIFVVRMLRETTPSMSSQDGAAAALSPTITNEHKPLPKMFTAYDVEQRLRAIDRLYGLLGGNVMEASADGERLNKSLADKAPTKATATELEKYADATDEVLKNYFETAGKFKMFYDIFHDATALVWNPFEVVNSAKNLAAEIKSLEQQDANIPAYLRNNKFMAEFNSATSGRFWSWINEKQQLLENKRREYEAAPVYPR